MMMPERPKSDILVPLYPTSKNIRETYGIICTQLEFAIM